MLSGASSPFLVEKMDEVLEYESVNSITDIMDTIGPLNDFDILSDSEDDEDLGRYYADEFCTLADVPPYLLSYFDYEAYSRDIRLEPVGCHTSYGFVMNYR